MTDQRDPYADRPYVPPTAPQESQPTGASGGWPFSEPRAQDAPTGDLPTHSPTTDHEPTVAMSEPTVAFGGGPGGPQGPGNGGPQGPGPVAPQPRKKRRAGRLVAAATGVVLLAGASAAGGAAIYAAMEDDGPVTSNTGTTLDKPVSSSQTTSDVMAAAEAVLPATVKINVTGSGESGTGTGVVISENGTILTNNHVIEAAADGGSITVAFNDGTNAKARIVGRDVATDVAVIQAEDVDDLPTATLGNSKDVKVGQTVVAIGSPFGLESTVTTGIVSALNRPVSPGDGSGSGGTTTTFPAIQTDAAINPGNSGGPLVDIQGNVIGINSAINTGGNGNGSVGLGFAIPINLVNSVASQILDGKTVEHAQIGVQVSNATSEDQVTTTGAEISEVSAGSAGEKAGLKAGDIVTKVDGNPISSNGALVATVRGYRPGDTIDLTVLRDGKTRNISVKLGSDNGAAAKAQD
ncbi:S1C family serine protease [Aeromicrobium senzhongii]|nr:trypsin-like peptidase domain-containing protein [Aeromicrobium senzhongii]